MFDFKQFAKEINAEVVDALVRNIDAMPADKQTWSPAEGVRSAHAQLQECAVITGSVVSMINSKAVPDFDHEKFGAMMAEFDTVEKAKVALRANLETLNAAIDAFPADELSETIKLPWFEAPQSFAKIMLISYWNNTYHLGQFNYIQTMYGDHEMH